MSARPIARRQIRLAVKDALESAALGATIISPGVEETQSESLPAVLFRVTHGTKEPLAIGPQNFTTMVYLELETKVEEDGQEAAQDALEALDQKVEAALLTNYTIIHMTEKITVGTETMISSLGRHHLAVSKWQFCFQLPEVFDPVFCAPDAVQPVAVPLDGIDLHWRQN